MLKVRACEQVRKTAVRKHRDLLQEYEEKVAKI